MRKTQTGSRLNFVSDAASVTRDSGRQMDWDLVPNSFRQTAFTVTVATAAAADAVTVAVGAIEQPLTKGTTLAFGGGKFARLSQPALKGAATLNVEAIPKALIVGDKAVHGGDGAKFVPGGTAVVYLTSGKMVPYSVRPNTEAAQGLMVTNATDGSKTDALSGYGVYRGGVMFENLLPDATGTPKVLPTQIKSDLLANGTGFAFEQYSDSRAN